MVIYLEITEKPTRPCICIHILYILSKVSEEIATESAENCRRLTSRPRRTPANTRILVHLIFPETRIIGLHFAVDSRPIGLSSFKLMGFRKTHLLCQSAYRPLKVIQGHSFWYQSKARMRLPISPS